MTRALEIYWWVSIGYGLAHLQAMLYVIIAR